MGAAWRYHVISRRRDVSTASRFDPDGVAAIAPAVLVARSRIKDGHGISTGAVLAIGGRGGEPAAEAATCARFY
jgi:hypothetical protein